MRNLPKSSRDLGECSDDVAREVLSTEPSAGGLTALVFRSIGTEFICEIHFECKQTLARFLTLSRGYNTFRKLITSRTFGATPPPTHRTNVS